MAELDRLYDAYGAADDDEEDVSPRHFVIEHEFGEPIYFPLYQNRAFVQDHVKSVTISRIDARMQRIFGLSDASKYRQLLIVMTPDRSQPEIELKYVSIRHVDGKKGYGAVSTLLYDGAYYDRIDALVTDHLKQREATAAHRSDGDALPKRASADFIPG